MSSQLSNLFAGMAVICGVLIAYFIVSLIANYMLLGKIGRKKWPGLIPYVNDYFLFDSFWDNKAFAAWIVLYILTILCVRSSNHTLTIIGMILSICNFVLSIMLYSKISKAFGKSALYTLGLVIIYPVFAIILVYKGELTSDFSDELSKKMSERQAKNKEDRR